MRILPESTGWERKERDCAVLARVREILEIVFPSSSSLLFLPCLGASERGRARKPPLGRISFSGTTLTHLLYDFAQKKCFVNSICCEKAIFHHLKWFFMCRAEVKALFRRFGWFFYYTLERDSEAWDEIKGIRKKISGKTTLVNIWHFLRLEESRHWYQIRNSFFEAGRQRFSMSNRLLKMSKISSKVCLRGKSLSTLIWCVFVDLFFLCDDFELKLKWHTREEKVEENNGSKLGFWLENSKFTRKFYRQAFFHAGERVKQLTDQILNFQLNFSTRPPFFCLFHCTTWSFNIIFV